MILKLLCIMASVVGMQLAGAQEPVIQGTGLFVEPGVSYQVTHSNLDYPAAGSSSAAVARGWGAVLRGGVHVYERFFVAADARYEYFKFSDNAMGYSSRALGWNIAPVIGMQMADYGVRLFVGYALAGELDPSSDNNLDLKFQQPQGWRIGAGLKIQQISVNIEWQRLEYQKTVLQQRGALPATATGSGMKYNPEGIIASVTFPIEFN